MDGRIASLEEPLHHGSEVALLPPVSGGSDAPLRAALVDSPIDAGSLLAAVWGPGRGAGFLFYCTVRDRHAGREVALLT